MKEKLKQQSLLSQLSDDLVVDDEAELLKAVAACVSKLIHAERTTLWIVDGDELYSILNEGVSDRLRIPKTSGIAGHCATFGEFVFVKDAQRDDRYDSSNDAKYNYVTRNIAAMPVRIPSSSVAVGKVVAVLQVINMEIYTDNGYIEGTLEAFASKIGIGSLTNRRVNK